MRHVKKQISYYLDLPEWKALKAEAPRQGVPLTILCRQLLQPARDNLRPASLVQAPSGPIRGLRPDPKAC